MLGDNDCIVKITANGRVVKKTEKVPVNARIVVEVYDGRLGELRDSLQNEEYYRLATESDQEYQDPSAEEVVVQEEEVPAASEEPEEDPVFIE